MFPFLYIFDLQWKKVCPAFFKFNFLCLWYFQFYFQFDLLCYFLLLADTCFSLWPCLPFLMNIVSYSDASDVLASQLFPFCVLVWIPINLICVCVRVPDCVCVSVCARQAVWTIVINLILYPCNNDNNCSRNNYFISELFRFSNNT